jgi:hypothetical protein
MSERYTPAVKKAIDILTRARSEYSADLAEIRLFNPALRAALLAIDKAVSELAAQSAPPTPGEAHVYGGAEGKVQVQFVGVSPSLKQGEYGWRPSDSAFIEAYVDEDCYRIGLGDYESSEGTRRGLHIVGPFDLAVDKHSINAVDLFRKPRAQAGGDPPPTTTAEKE